MVIKDSVLDFIAMRLTPEQLKKVAPDVCCQDCKKCSNYDSVRNYCNCASLNLVFPMFEFDDECLESD